MLTRYRPTPRRRLVLGLIGVSAIWGLTFPLVQDAVAEMPSMRFLAVRYLIATAALAVLVRRIDHQTLRAGVVLGCILFVGYVMQTFALRNTSSTNVAFITGMYVVFTPLFAATLGRRAPSLRALSGVAFAAAGLALLATPNGLTLARGDVFSLLCAATFATHIVGVGIVAPDVEPLALTAVQSAVAGILSLGASLATEPSDWTTPSWGTIGTLILTGVGASSIALVVQTRAQRVLPPTPVAVILTMESVFGGLFGYLLAGDRLSAAGYVGAGLIVTGVLIASTRTPEGASKGGAERSGGVA